MRRLGFCHSQLACCLDRMLAVLGGLEFLRCVNCQSRCHVYSPAQTPLCTVAMHCQAGPFYSPRFYLLDTSGHQAFSWGLSLRALSSMWPRRNCATLTCHRSTLEAQLGATNRRKAIESCTNLPQCLAAWPACSATSAGVRPVLFNCWEHS